MTSISALYDLFLRSAGVSTDTRTTQPGQLFFALKGDNFNGNQFAAKALEAGATFAIIDEEAYKADERFLLVPNVLKALQDLASHHRNALGIPVLAITGSNGKTTTKELCALVLAKKYRVHATKGNFNNHIGVPLTLLSMPNHTEIAVIEMGDNRLGDVEELCGIARPTHGLITNVGKDHIEGFGSFEGNIRAKSELFQFLRETEGTPLINLPDPIVGNMAKRFKSPIGYGQAGAFANLTFVEANPFIVYTGEEGQQVQTQLIGRHNFENIQTAYCVGKLFEVPIAQVHEALAGYVPQNNRSQVIQTPALTILLDAYNANPSSMQAAINMLDELQSPAKTAILGDMLELGSISEAEHREMVDYVCAKGFTQVIFCGKEFERHARAGAAFFPDKEAVAEYLKQHPIKAGTVLLKGSRGIKLEALLSVLQS
jgi:UDP-N-acetylmuramoyl-tripeptide--D-alanyl-D-alanine ligase